MHTLTCRLQRCKVQTRISIHTRAHTQHSWFRHVFAKKRSTSIPFLLALSLWGTAAESALRFHPPELPIDARAPHHSRIALYALCAPIISGAVDQRKVAGLPHRRHREAAEAEGMSRCCSYEGGNRTIGAAEPELVLDPLPLHPQRR
jgi:hypothetical protein